MPLSDEQIKAAFTGNMCLTDHNGQHCGRAFYDSKGQMTSSCGAGTVVKNGQVLLLGHCGKVCGFLKSACEFADEVTKLQTYAGVLERKHRGTK